MQVFEGGCRLTLIVQYVSDRSGSSMLIVFCYFFATMFHNVEQ